MSVSPPKVVYRTERGQRLEPFEEVICEVDEKEAGAVIEVGVTTLSSLLFLPDPAKKMTSDKCGSTKGVAGVCACLETALRGEAQFAIAK